MGAPGVHVHASYSAVETQRFGVTPGTSVELSLLSGVF